MWQQLINEVGMIWVVLVLVLTAGIAALTGVLWFLLARLARATSHRLTGLSDDVNTLPSIKIENLKQIQVIVGERGGIAMKTALNELAEDSHTHYEGFWVPDPAERLECTMLIPTPKRWLIRPSLSTLPLLAAILVSFIAFLVALSISATSFGNDWMRFLGLLPLIIGGLSWMLLQQVRRQSLDTIDTDWDRFLVRLRRKLPVYDQAAQTAALLKQYVHYDQQMTQAARKLSDRVDALASGELTDSITGAVKYVMAASVAPPIQKSTDSLNLLARELEKKLITGENQIIRLATELESRQREQAELWQSRYSEAVDKLTGQQREQLELLVTTSQSHWKNLQDKLTALFSDLGDGQRRLQSDLLNDQKDSLHAIRQASETNFETMKNDYAKTLQDQTQSQQIALERLQAQQTSLAENLKTDQAQAFEAIQHSQAETLSQISQQLSGALQKIETAQTEALTRFTQTQQDAIQALDQQQRDGVDQLLDRFSGQVSDALTSHLSPVSERLSDAAQALISAQTYAKSVEKTLALQKEQSEILERNIHDVLAEFVTTRQVMTDDLDALAKSTSIMSESSASMSAVYTGSQTGLSDSIDRMSNDMVALSESLQEVLRGSAEQTRSLQEQANETYEINQQHLDAVRSQIDILTNDLSTRIDQLLIGFSQLTEDLIQNVQTTINNQNSELGTGLKALTEVMADEARSISLYAQQINMDIGQLNQNLGESVKGFSEGISLELNEVLTRFDAETADILRRLSVAASELGDAVEVLPEVIRSHTSGSDQSKNG